MPGAEAAMRGHPELHQGGRGHSAYEVHDMLGSAMSCSYMCACARPRGGARNEEYARRTECEARALRAPRAARRAVSD